jgi:hypothetical protein
VLASFLEAPSEAEASAHLADLLSVHVAPVIEQILRANISWATFGFSRTVERESPIRDFRGYVASTTYSAR